MSPKLHQELSHVAHDPLAIATFNQKDRFGHKDPVLQIAEGHVEGAPENVHYFVAFNPENSDQHLGVVKIEEEGDTAHLVVEASAFLEEKEELLQGLVTIALEEVAVTEVVIDPESDTNLTPAILRHIGFAAVQSAESNLLHFELAA